MIKAVLLDLDDTLIESHAAESFASYLRSLGDFGAQIAPPDQFIRIVMDTCERALIYGDAAHTLYETFIRLMAASVHRDERELARLFDTYYSECYAILRPFVQAREESRVLLDWMYRAKMLAVVATGPGLPETAIRQRLGWGGLPADQEDFALITTSENMHFGKPHAEYYEEIMLRLALSPGEAIMVGDDWENDIVGASRAGLSTYWIAEDYTAPPDTTIPLSGYGSYQRFIDLAQSGWLDSLPPLAPNRETLVHRLRAFPASIDVLRRTYRPTLLECAPADSEWSARDIICHLRDHEAAEDRARLGRIAIEDNPFISANYDPWAHAHEYAKVSVDRAFAEFAHDREVTVDWIMNLPATVWDRPARYAIFGPTSFQEMVRFTTEHDLTHLRQMRRAIDLAQETCGG